MMHHKMTSKSHGAAAAEGAPKAKMPKGYLLVAVVYLPGLCLGALDMSIVNPARTVIQNTMSIDDSLGVWIITIYTLAYAASIPVMGKLADRHGRKSIYLLCVLLFGTGSLLCGISQSVGSFEMLLFARIVQALGGGGIMPVATAEFGTAFPEEMRGMALGIVGMVYGLASILGPSVGSAILDIFGQTQWQYIFFLNVPICLAILIIGPKRMKNAKMDDVKPIDGLGILLLTCMTLSLMYGLKNINFFNFAESVQETTVWPFLLVFVLLLPLFVLREKRAADPIMNLSYFKNANIIITLLCAVVSGIVMMGTIFFPQFCENAMMMKSGSGGYLLAILGVGTAFGAMGSGKLIDQHGVRPVLAAGFVGAIAGSLFMAFVACEYPSTLTVCATMFITGLGLGFTMGTPLNYMMLQNTDDAESSSALATMSLVRSIGTAVAPAIMVAFIVHASAGMQTALMEAMPKVPGMSAAMTQQAEPGTTTMELSPQTLEQLQNSDVTTVVDACKSIATDMFSQMEAADKAPASMIEKARDAYLAQIDDAAEDIQIAYQQTMNGGFRGMAIFVTICAALGLLLLIPYKEKRPAKAEKAAKAVEA